MGIPRSYLFELADGPEKGLIGDPDEEDRGGDVLLPWMGLMAFLRRGRWEGGMGAKGN